MLTSERGADRSATPSGAVSRATARRPDARLVAALLGGLGALLAVLVPFAPVVQDTATIAWPSPSTGTRDVEAPLVAYRPQALAMDVPCAAARSVDARTAGPATVFSTTPPTSPDGRLRGLTITADAGQLVLTDRGQVLATGTLDGASCRISVRSAETSTTVELGSTAPVSAAADVRPQVAGIYSDLDDARDPTAGVGASIDVDTRYRTGPTTLKLALSVAAAACVLGSLVALHTLDRRFGRRPVRTRRRRRRPSVLDGVVVAVLAVWVVIGSETSDDGYILGIARARESAGYIGNFFRWFNAPEAPFGWFYEVYALWARVDDSVLWLRLPAFVMGLVSWWLISRTLLPRLGGRVRSSRAATWAAGMVFLMFWLPFDGGLRPEPVAVIAGLVAIVCVEHSLATRTLAPVGLGLVGAALALAATPTGLMAAAPFLAAARPLFRLVQQRARRTGLLALLMPLLAAGLAVLLVIFADQTWSAVAEASRIRFALGPSAAWDEEFIRYQALFGEDEAGSLARRAPVLFLALGLVTCLVVLVRRGRIPGAAVGPSSRLLGTTLIGFLVLTLTPTKWTHHFGAFAALGAGVAALTALATSPAGLRSRRNRLLFLGAALGVLGVAFTGRNAWWHTNSWGVPWFDKPVSYQGYQLSTVCLLAAVAALVLAAVEHLRGPVGDRPRDGRGLPARIEARLARWRAAVRPGTGAGPGARTPRVQATPIAVIAGLLVLFEVASLAKAVDARAGTFSLGRDVLPQVVDGTCGLAGAVRVENGPLVGLPPTPDPPALVPASPPVLPTIAPPGTEAAGVPLPPGVFSASSPQAEVVPPGATDVGFHHVDATPPGGGATGASGYEYVPRRDLAPFTLGTYDRDGRGTGVLRTPWSALDDDVRAGRVPLVVAAAGKLGGGNALLVQYGQRLPDGRVRVTGQQAVDDGADGEPPWREFTIDLPQTAGAGADVARLVAQDHLLGPTGWLAVAPMRAPRLQPMTDVVGQAPMFMEWPVQFPNPCLRQFTVRDGIGEMPEYRMAPAAAQFRGGLESWSAAAGGGPTGWIEVLADAEELPSSLVGDDSRAWGRVERLERYAPDVVPPAVEHGQRTVWGWTDQGRIGDPPLRVPALSR